MDGRSTLRMIAGAIGTAALLGILIVTLLSAQNGTTAPLSAVAIYAKGMFYAVIATGICAALYVLSRIEEH
jgi:hypothetical protein